MLTKESILDAIQRMPEDNFSTVEPIIEHLILLEKINEGLRDIDEGRFITLSQLKEEMKVW